MGITMKSQSEHRQDYFANAYKAGLTFQHNISGEWVDANPKDDPSIAPNIFPEHWRVKEHSELQRGYEIALGIQDALNKWTRYDDS